MTVESSGNEMGDNLSEEKTKKADINGDIDDGEKDQSSKRSKHSRKHKSKHSKKHKHKHKKRKHKRKSSSRSRSRSSSRSRSRSPTNSDDDDNSKLDTSCFENDDLESFKLSKSLPGSPAVVTDNKEEGLSASPCLVTECNTQNTKDGSESPPFYTEQDLLEREGKIPLAKSPTFEDGLMGKLNVVKQTDTMSSSTTSETLLDSDSQSTNKAAEQSSTVFEKVNQDEKRIDDLKVNKIESKSNERSKSRSPRLKKRKSKSRSKSRSNSPKSKRGKRSHSSSPEKKKSHKKSRSRSLSSRSRSRSPKKKNHSRSSDRRRSRSKDRRRSRSKDRKRSKSRDRKRSKSRERKRSRSKDRRSRSRDRRRSRSPTRNRKSYRASPRRKNFSYNSGKRYANRRSHSLSPRRRSSRRSRSRSPCGKYRGRSRSPRGRGYRPRSRSRSKSRSRRSRSRSYSSRRRRSRSRSRSRDRSTRRSRSKSTESNNDKKDNNNSVKINPTTTITSVKDLVGKAPTITDPSNKKSLEMLTEFCKKLTEARGIAENEEKEGDEDENKEEEEEEDVAISHPFLVAPKKDITIPQVIFPVKPILPVSMVDSSKPLTEQFPVSCGTKHHEKEHDEGAVTTVANVDGSALIAPPIAPQPVFQQPQEKLDIASLVVKRMDAQRKLKTNPSDIDAMLALQEIEHKLNSWCQSNVKPGQFTGHMAKQMMPKEKINAGYQAWAKKDMFHNLNPVRGGIGMKLLQKMGWEPGQVIGKSGKGIMEPIALTVKVDRKGLSSTLEKPMGKKGGPSVVPSIQTSNQAMVDLQGKHPISVLQELCARRKWNSPDFTLIFDEGPPHSKQFLFKVLVNGYEYQHPVVSGNKKHAKAQAAVAALKGLGLIPPDAQF